MSVTNRGRNEGDLSVYANGTEPKLSEHRQMQYDSLYENYLTDKSALEEQKSLAEQEASINHELLMKYLPVLNRQNGLYGLGVAQSANVEALANYQNNLNTINRNYAASMAELDKGWNDSRLSLYGQQAAEDREDKLLEDQRLREDKLLEDQRLREDSLADYKEAYDLIVAGADTKTKDEIYNYINSLGVDEATKERLGSLANYLYGEGEDSQDKGYTVDATFNNDGSFSSVIGGVRYNFTTGDEVSISKPDTYPEGEVFAYNAGLYVKRSGKIYQVLDGNGDTRSREYSYLYQKATEGKHTVDVTKRVKGEYYKNKGSVTIDGKKVSFNISDTATEIPELDKSLIKYADEGTVFGFSGKLYVVKGNKAHEITTQDPEKLYQYLMKQ